MKIKKLLVSIGILGLLSTSMQVQAAEWFKCGSLSQISAATNGNLYIGNAYPYPLTKYEYGIIYNTRTTSSSVPIGEPLAIVTTGWNYGIRVTNKQPYLVYSDNPATGMRYGGFVFYSGTLASDDNCGTGNFRHRYWYNTSTGIATDASNGCYGSSGDGGNPNIYCRLR